MAGRSRIPKTPHHTQSNVGAPSSIELGPEWVRKGNTWARGSVFLDGKWLEGDELANAAKSWTPAWLAAPGHWAIVHADGTMRSDSIRSFPIYYDSETISDQPGAFEAAPVERYFVAQLLAFGYVLGNHSIRRGVSSIGPGQVIKDGKVEAIHRQFDTPEKEFSGSWRELLDRVLPQWWQRLGGRKALVPLSDGWDSRLLLASLIEHHDDITTYTYGPAGSRAVKDARAVARASGVEWIHVPHSPSRWRRRVKTPAWHEYMRTAGGLTSLPTQQDAWSHQHLRDGDLDVSNAVSIPGHSGDFLGGSHLKPETSYPREPPELARVLAAKPAKFWSPDQVESALGIERAQDHWLAAIESFCQERLSAGVPAWRVAESWNWTERQAKFIINHGRIAERWGLEWMAPLWDPRIQDYWRSMSHADRFGKRRYDEGAAQLCHRAGIPGTPRRGKSWAQRRFPRVPHGLAGLAPRSVRKQLGYTKSNHVLAGWQWLQHNADLIESN